MRPPRLPLCSPWPALNKNPEYSLHICYVTAIIRILSLKKFCLFIQGHKNMFWNELNLGRKENMSSKCKVKYSKEIIHMITSFDLKN